MIAKDGKEGAFLSQYMIIYHKGWKKEEDYDNRKKYSINEATYIFYSGSTSNILYSKLQSR